MLLTDTAIRKAKPGKKPVVGRMTLNYLDAGFLPAVE